MELETEDERRKIRLRLMGLGGLSFAAQKMGFRPWRLSRILNGWIKASEDELKRIMQFLDEERKRES